MIHMKISFFFSFMIISSLSIAQKTSSSVIMLDKMNVLYLGTDNPISISSPVDFGNTTVTITNGTITGTGAHRIVKPEAIGQTTTITVSTTKFGPITYSYRVKKIPDPIFKMGSGKGYVNIAEFISQKVCRAELENFDFDFKFNIVSATVYFSGNGFENVVACNITGKDLSPLFKSFSKCEPGTVVIFDNIKVQGPDGVRTIDSQTYTLF